MADAARAIPLARSAPDQTESAVAVLTVDLEAVAANWRLLGARHGAPTAAVVKADAYGLGAARIAPHLFASGCRHFFVAHPDEAFAIRAALPGAMLAVLNGLWPGTAPDYAGAGLVPVLGSLGEIEAWREEARRRGRTLPAILHIDTGMHRLGLDQPEFARLAADLTLLEGIELRYTMTHLVSAETPANPINARQRTRFAAARAMLPPAPASLANSSGIFLGPDFASDLARPGAALYGVNPVPGQVNPMRPALRLAASVLQTRWVPQGETVGYNGIWTAHRPSRIATVSVGYADGLCRALGNVATAAFDGKPVPLVGRVSMDLTTYDVTDHPGLEVGDWLELIGPDMPPDLVAARAGTNAYEVLTSLGRRLPRRYRPL